ncbi:MAG: hypothetical protein JOY81_06075 [Alphaproteobacteria bacterium]|nr:hypothetical protein [Alphaproteobacteria bacterium]
MIRIKTTAAIAAALLTVASTGAYAQYRQEQVQDRVQDTNQRINREYREGEISRGEARELKHENREIQHEENAMARDGLSRGEQRSLNQQENQLNRQITRESR